MSCVFCMLADQYGPKTRLAVNLTTGNVLKLNLGLSL